MKGSSIFKVVSLAISLVAPTVRAQSTADTYTDPQTNITFLRTTVPNSLTTGGFQFGLALPGTAEGTNDEYIGQIVGAIHNGTNGWAGISHAGGMPNALLLMAWVDGAQIRTSFRYAGGYVAPSIYTGNATLTQLGHTINATHFTLTYHCNWCWVWNQNGAAGSQLPTGDTQVIGWAQHNSSPSPSTSSSGTITEHDNGQGEFGATVASARNPAYSQWAGKGGNNGTVPSASPTFSTTPTPTAPTACVGTPAPTGAWDYIVVGAGAGGIPIADKLSEGGKSVLLIEKGPPSSGRYNGTMKPTWLEGTNLTRFDVPGLCNQIWVDSAGIACTDIDQMAGCVLGGGTAVNAALWWRPNPVDWDYNFPAGWKATDMDAASKRVFNRIPGTYFPSADGKLYKPEGYNVLSTALANGGWKHVVANDVPDQKTQTFSHTPYMFQHGERDGPMATYLATFVARKNAKLWMNTAVRRVIRTKGKVTGVELDGGNGGYCGTVNLTATGRVILSAGTFGSTKLLFRSGIGPKDQLQTVATSIQDGGSMINSSDWINLPVGQNLNDHVNTDLVIRHPNVSFYDFYQAWSEPIPSDKDMYLNNRTGILTQSAPNIGPMFWDVIKGKDGINRQLQWTARVEPSPPATDNTSMTMSQYLGRGSTSRGVLSINGALNMYVSTVPYLHTQEDIDAVVTGIENLQKAIATVPEIVWEVPNFQNMTARDFVNSIPVTASKRRSNHWIGTAKLGTDSGLTGGTAVVDTNTKVYGTDNLFVVDASVFPGHISTNPSAYIVAIAEQAAAKILALSTSGSGGNTGAGGSTGTVAAYQQCGGSGYTGSTQCASGYKCKAWNSSYSQCTPA